MIAKWSYRLASIFFLAAPVTIPLFYLPLTTDYFQFNKLVLFYLLTGLGLISWLIYSIATKTVRLTLSPALAPFLFLTAATVASTLFNKPVSLELWFNFSGIYLAGLIYFIFTSTIIQTATQMKTALLLISASITIAAVAAALNFPLAGSALNLVGLLISWLPATLVLALKIRSGSKKIVYFLLSGLIISSLILNGYKMLPGQELQPLLLPKSAGWSIAVDTLKSKLFLGTGPGKFSESFSQFKPVSLNQNNLWNVNFTVSSNAYLEILTTMGLAGLATLIWLIITINKLRQRQPGTRITSSQMALLASLFTQIILGLFIPFTVVNWVLFFSCLSLLVVTQKSKLTTQVKDVILSLTAITLIEPGAPDPNQGQGWSRPILPWLVAIPATVVLILIFFQLSKVYKADYYFQKSLIAAAANQGKETYDQQVKAIGLMPGVDRYRISYSNTNLALSNSLAAKSDLSDQDRQTVATLIQQSIREARIATQLNPNKAFAWANLANVYKTLINFAQGADQYSQAAYVRAIQLDPANPGLRLSLGGLFYQMKNYGLAADRFTEAVQLKPNFANAYYNLSYAYQQQQKWLEAYQAMQQVVALVEPDSDDGIKVRNELNDLEKKLPRAQETKEKTPAEGEAQLVAPSPAPTAPKNFQPINVEPSPLP